MTGIVLPTVDDTRQLGAALGAWLRAGDLVVLTGELGAGKTTLTQGLGEGLGVRGPVISPTFVIAREHPSVVGGPGLVHVDAYRLGSAAEVDDIDLDESFEECVTVIEWGQGLVEQLSDHWVEVVLDREAVDADAAGTGGEGADARVASIALVGPWPEDRRATLAALLRRGVSFPSQG